MLRVARPSAGISLTCKPRSFPFSPQNHRSPISSHPASISWHALAQLSAMETLCSIHNLRRMRFAAPLGDVHIRQATSAAAAWIFEPRLSRRIGCTGHNPQRNMRSTSQGPRSVSKRERCTQRSGDPAATVSFPKLFHHRSALPGLYRKTHPARAPVSASTS